MDRETCQEKEKGQEFHSQLPIIQWKKKNEMPWGIAWRWCLAVCLN